MLRINPRAFIRHEPNYHGNNVFIFVGDTSEAYEANEDVYEILQMIKRKIPNSELLKELKAKYDASEEDEIERLLNATIHELLLQGVIEEIEDNNIL